jgi:hypothetical protein
MPWFEDDSYPSGWRWERADVDPVTQMLPIIPPLTPTRIPAYVPPPAADEPDLPQTQPTPFPREYAPSAPAVTSGYDTPAEPDPPPSYQEKRVKLSREPALLYIGFSPPWCRLSPRSC